MVAARQNNKTNRAAATDTSVDGATCRVPAVGRKGRRARSAREAPPAGNSVKSLLIEGLNGFCGTEPQAPVSPPPDEHRGTLSRTIEGEIIPRLLLLHRSVDARRLTGLASPSLPQGAGPDARSDARLPAAEEIEDFAQLILRHDASVSCSYVAAVRTRGVSLESVCLELLAPTARRLGEMWEEDEVDFTQVTVGLWRLQQVLHALSPPFERHEPLDLAKHRVLLAPTPGDQHTFGLIMVADFFRRAGWYVCDSVGPSQDALVEKVRSEHFDIVGLSIGSAVRFDALRTVIRALRRSSMNRGMCVMVGGSPFVGHPERAATVGADATAADARDAPAQAVALLEAQRAERN